MLCCARHWQRRRGLPLYASKQAGRHTRLDLSGCRNCRNQMDKCCMCVFDDDTIIGRTQGVLKSSELGPCCFGAAPSPSFAGFYGGTPHKQNALTLGCIGHTLRSTPNMLSVQLYQACPYLSRLSFHDFTHSLFSAYPRTPVRVKEPNIIHWGETGIARRTNWGERGQKGDTQPVLVRQG